MEQFTPNMETVTNLAEREAFPSLSLFFPLVFEKGYLSQKNEINLEHALETVQDELEAQGVDDDTTETLVDSVRGLTRDGFRPFATGRTQAIGIFVSPQIACYCLSPLSWPMETFVQSRFNVKHLVRHIAFGAHYLVLSLGRSYLQLYRGDDSGLEPVGLPQKTPRSFAEVFRNVEFEPKPVYHATGTPETPGGTYGKRYGINPRDKEGRYIEDYCNTVAPYIDEALQSEHSPLFIIAPDRYHTAIRHALSYPHQVEERIAMSTERMAPHQVFEKIYPAIEEWRSREMHRQADDFFEHYQTPTTAHGVADVLRFGAEGRVNALFVKPETAIWGQYDPEHQDVIIHDDKQPGDSDLIGDISSTCLRHDSRIFIADHDFVTRASHPVGATLRW